MSPVLVRPIREQVEHDRVIRQLQSRWRRKYEVAINVGNDEEAPVRVSGRLHYPDLVLTSTSSGRRLHGIVEVETAESINHLEAMAEWKHFGKVRGAFYLYVPAGFTDVAERLCADTRVNVTEVWAYYAIGSQVKFSMTYRSPRARAAAKTAQVVKPSKAARPAKKAAKKAATKTAKKVAKKPPKKRAKKTAKKVAKKPPKKRAKTAQRGSKKKRAKVKATKKKAKPAKKTAAKRKPATKARAAKKKTGRKK